MLLPFCVSSNFVIVILALFVSFHISLKQELGCEQLFSNEGVSMTETVSNKFQELKDKHTKVSKNWNISRILTIRKVPMSCLKYVITIFAFFVMFGPLWLTG